VREIDLLRRYPKSSGRGTMRPEILEEDRRISKQFGEDYFDGPRSRGYGGYRYHERFWSGVAEDLRDEYKIGAGTTVLDIGCAKGFLLHDLRRAAPGVEVYGLDVSEYAIRNSMEDVRPTLVRGSADRLPFPDDAFDVVLCINTIHNLTLEGCERAIHEIERVKRPGGHSYLQLDSWLNDRQRDDFLAWQLTAVTYFGTQEWERLFERWGYTGDYYWTIAE